MKKTFKKVLIGVTTLATMATALVPLNASAIAKVLYTYPDGTELTGGLYDELAGFDEDGNPIIEHYVPDEEFVPTSALYTDIDTTIGESDDNGLYSEPTNIRGDVNYDGLVNNVDVMLLRKYILHMIEW